MTNEEKINRLRDIQRCTPIHTRDGIRDFEALEGGIEALEALSKIQLQQIEKKDYPFEGLEKYDLFKMDNLVVVPLYQVIDHLSQPQGEWIPVSERLPEDLKPVNITWVNHEPEPYYHDIKDKNFVATGIHYRGRWYWYSTTCADYLGEYGSNDIDKVDDAVEIVAWMPLPEPYEPQESEDKE